MAGLLLFCGFGDPRCALAETECPALAPPVLYGSPLAEPQYIDSTDIDQDGDVDVAIAGKFFGPVSVFLNNGDGTFAAPFQPAGIVNDVSNVLLRDVNGDSLPDIVVGTSSVFAGFSHGFLTVLLNQGPLGFPVADVLEIEPLLGLGAFGIADAADMDNDGDIDVVGAFLPEGGGQATLVVLRNNGLGEFQIDAQYPIVWPPFIVIGRVDGDADLDVVVAYVGAGPGGFSVFLNEGDGSLALPILHQTKYATRRVAIGDIDNDCSPDLAIIRAGPPGKVEPFLGDGTGELAAQPQDTLFTDSGPGAIDLADLDDDGDLEIVTVNFDFGTVSVFENNGDGLYLSALNQPASALGTGDVNLSIADFDGDGNLDVATVNFFDEGISILLSTCADQGRGGIAGGTPEKCFPGPRFWYDPSGGVFGDPANWKPQAVPGPLDSAVLYLQGSPYTVAFDAPPNDTQQLLCTGGDVTLDLGGQAWSLISALDPALLVAEVSNDVASLTVTGGSLTATNTEIGREPGAIGAVSVVGADTTFTTLNSLRVGNLGNGSLTIADGADVLSLFAFIGDGAGSSGLVNMNGSGSTWNVPFFMFLNNGAVDVGADCELSVGFGLFVSENGTITGGGTIAADIVNFGNVVPGPDLGVLTIDGDYDQVGQLPGFGPNSGTLEIQVIGDTPGIEYDVLAVTGNATLAGGLLVDIGGGFQPEVGATFEVLDADAIIDQFDVAFFKGLPAGRFAKLEQELGVGPGGGLSVVIESLGTLVELGDPESFGFDNLPTGVAVADFDGEDGVDLAIVVPNADPQQNGMVLVLYNNGIDGGGKWLGFGDQLSVLVGKDPSAVTVGDFDGDPMTRIDLAVTNRADNTVSLRFNTGDRSFGNAAEFAVASQPVGIAAEDFDEDQVPDLAIASTGDGVVEIFRNDGGGVFIRRQTVTTGPMQGPIQPIDLDDDDKCIDIFLPLSGLEVGGGGQGGALAVLRNTLGVFQQPELLPIGDTPADARAADLDADGDTDIVAVNQGDGTVSVLLNTGDGTFLPDVQIPVGAAPRSITSLDLELDGDIDLAVVTGSDEANEPILQVLRNDLNGGTQLAFADAEELDVGEMPLFVVAADLDRDLTDDLVTVNEGAGGGVVGGAPTGSVNSLINAGKQPRPPTPVEDLNGDGVVDGADLGMLLGAWGTCIMFPCVGDINGDGIVNGGDLGFILGAWD